MKINTQKCFRALAIASICAYVFLLSAKLTNNFNQNDTADLIKMNNSESISMAQ